jgi:CBS domain-containing protein
MNTLLIAIGGFVLLVVLLVFLRIKTGNKFEIKNSDVVLALIPVAFWLFLTGKIQEFTFGDFRIVAAIKEASNSPVAAQVTELPVESVSMGAKGGVGEIPELIRRKNQALSFRLGHGGYYGPAIQEYLKVLTQNPFLRYIVINNADGSFFGMADARQFTAMLQANAPSFSAQAFAQWLNDSNKGQIETLPGFISAQHALKKVADKRQALELMESQDVENLPVVDDDGRFIGIVDRSKLTASMLIEIADRVETPK